MNGRNGKLRKIQKPSSEDWVAGTKTTNWGPSNVSATGLFSTIGRGGWQTGAEEEEEG
jgi:hypothetical protein